MSVQTESSTESKINDRQKENSFHFMVGMRIYSVHLQPI